MNALLRWLGVLGVVFIAAPMFIVVPISFSDAPGLQFPPPGYWLGYYKAYFSDPSWLRPTYNSLLIATATTALTLLLVVPSSFALVRHRFHGKGVAQMLILLPLAVPHIVMAIGYYSFLADIKLAHTHFGVVLAHTCLAVPIAFLAMSANLKGFDLNVERAARSLGASATKTFFHVTLPILKPGIAVSGLFAFISSFDETVVAIFISGAGAETLPRKMFASIRERADPVIAVVSTLLFAIVLVVLLAPYVSRWLRKKKAAPAQGAMAVESS